MSNSVSTVDVSRIGSRSDFNTTKPPCIQGAIQTTIYDDNNVVSVGSYYDVKGELHQWEYTGDNLGYTGRLAELQLRDCVFQRVVRRIAPKEYMPSVSAFALDAVWAGVIKVST